jgi:methanogenic corrinoid protein MtbC1
LSVICACTEGDYHEIGLKLLSYALEAEGWAVHYLGANTPFDTLRSLMKSLPPQLVCLSSTIVKRKKEQLEGLHEIGELARTMGVVFVIGGALAMSGNQEELLCDYLSTSVHDAISFAKDRFQMRPGPKRVHQG